METKNVQPLATTLSRRIRALTLPMLFALVMAFGLLGHRAGNVHFGDGLHAAMLTTSGWCLIDWYAPESFARNKRVLRKGGTLILQARFKWTGAGVLRGREHVVLAYAQGKSDETQPCEFTPGSRPEPLLNSPAQPMRQKLFTHGIGAYLSETGLAIELWGDRGPGTALVWNAHNDRCAQELPTGLARGPCWGVAFDPVPADFHPDKSRYYRLRMELEGNPDEKTGLVRLTATLLDEKTGRPRAIQKGTVELPLEVAFPHATKIRAFAARAQSEGDPDLDDIAYWMFDHVRERRGFLPRTSVRGRK